MLSSLPEVFTTGSGTPYLREPGAILIGRTESVMQQADHLEELSTFLTELGFDPEEYFTEEFFSLPGAEQVMKFAGQGCYMSYGSGHTGDTDEKVQGYFDNQKRNKDGSVFEHASLSFQLYGISRSLSHELVRHRAGYGFSQLSQRYVDGARLRFVEGPEYQQDSILHTQFMDWIDQCRFQYNDRSENLIRSLFKDLPPAESREERVYRRKVANAAARRCLPNETETMMVATANVRALRHTLETRSTMIAEIEIRRLFDEIYEVCLQEVPHLFTDYVPKQNDDHTITYTTPYPKA